jgi:hypothetical protein
MWRLFRRDDLHIALWTVLLLSTFVLDRAR